ncbi:hypothetical protein VOM14_03285 [Paraburkholderia sp. MPAMCS5]|uniref:hypothetical protein n=1 Tax=Paraburkholderia sp. MPAMCS5 TaxID=3112563 RepID=UPI002E1768F9|nr:hypothetical protein [Paraburkholderia sp. MPAMCS5]
MLVRLGSRFVAIGAFLFIAGCGGGGGGASNPGTGSNGAGSTAPSGASSTTPTLAAATPVVDGTALGDSNWPTGSTSSGGTGQPVSAMNCGLRSNSYTYTHLSIYQNGRLLSLPANIGMVSPTMAAQTGCAYPMHTVDASGKIHMDTTTGASYTLGQFFAIWGEPLSTSNVAGVSGSPVSIYVNDGGALTQYKGDPASLVLPPHGEVTIMVGTPLTQIPSYTWTDPPPFDTNATTLTYGGTVGTQYWQNGNTSTGGTGADVDGLTCAANMSELYHVHAHLAIVNNGQWLALPMNVGLLSQCSYEMHTHDQTGIIHIETPNVKTYTLGQFFDIWGQPLTSTNVAGVTGNVVAYINDNGDSRRYMGDLRNIELTSMRDVTLQIGTPPVSKLPIYTWTDETQ